MRCSSTEEHRSQFVGLVYVTATRLGISRGRPQHRSVKHHGQGRWCASSEAVEGTAVQLCVLGWGRRRELSPRDWHQLRLPLGAIVLHALAMSYCSTSQPAIL